jgi:arylsulfatase A-like enzyme
MLHFIIIQMSVRKVQNMSWLLHSKDRVNGRLLTALGMLIILSALVVWLAFRPSPGMNVILITIDTLRADHLSVYGYPRQTSPALDALAREGVLFKNAYSQGSETNPSLSSLMTSYLPLETKVVRNNVVLPAGAETLAEILRSHQYRTGAIVSNFSLRRGSGFEQGFETYDDHMDDRSQTKWEGTERLAPKTTAAAINWLKAHSRDKFFLWIHYMDPHYPYLPPPPYNTMFLTPQLAPDRWVPFNNSGSGKGGIDSSAQLGNRHELQFYISQYDGEIRFFDQSLGDLLQALRAFQLMDNTLIVLVGDHGEGMGEHDYYFAHHEFVYEGLLRVPLLVRFPDGHQAGQIISNPVAAVDVLPTILETLAVEPPRTARGRHLLLPEPRSIFAMTAYRSEKMALIAEGKKLVETDEQTELYDLQKDPNEQNNLVTEEVTEEEFNTVARLKQVLAGVMEEDRLGLGAPVYWNLDDASERKMKALGYVQ